MATSGTKIRVSRPLHCGIPVIGRSIHRRYSLRNSQLGAMQSQTTQPDLYEYKHNVRVMAVLHSEESENGFTLTVWKVATA